MNPACGFASLARGHQLRILHEGLFVSAIVSTASRSGVRVPHRLVGYLQWAFRPRHPDLGWDPREPTFLGFALALLVLASFLPWWGFQVVTVDPRRPVVFEKAIQFGPWLTTYWSATLSGGSYSGFSVDSTPLLWWQFPRGFSNHAAYTPVSASLCGLWSSAFFLVVFAFWARSVPRSRLKGWPTVAGATAAILLIAAIVVAILGFPLLGGYPSFAGALPNDTVTWGPGLGWFLLIGAAVLGVASTVIGRRVDRRLVGVCWYCFRGVSGPYCEHCRSIQ